MAHLRTFKKNDINDSGEHILNEKRKTIYNNTKNISYSFSSGNNCILKNTKSNVNYAPAVNIAGILCPSLSCLVSAKNYETLLDIKKGALFDTSCSQPLIPPTFTSIPPKSAFVNNEYNYNVTMHYVDCYNSTNDNHGITLSAEILPDWLTFSPNTGLLSGRPLHSHLQNDNIVKITAFGDGFNVNQDFTITVDYNKPVINSIPPTSVELGSPYTYTLDIGNINNSIILSAEVLPVWLSFDQLTGILGGTPVNFFYHIGNHSVVLKVTDGITDIVHSFTINVYNFQLNVTTVGSTNYFIEGTDRTGSISGENLDLIFKEGDVVKFDVVDAYDNPFGIHITEISILDDSTTTNTLFHPIANGTIYFACSGDFIDTEFKNVQYKSSSTDISGNISIYNFGFTSAPQNIIQAGSLYTYTITTQENTPQFYGEVIPNWLSFDSVTGDLSGTPTISDVGTHHVVIMISVDDPNNPGYLIYKLQGYYITVTE